MPISRLDFRNRFTDVEKHNIYAAAKVSVDIQIYLDEIAIAEDVDLTNARTVAGVHALEAAGLISAGRADEILGVVSATLPPIGGFAFGQLVRLKSPYNEMFPGDWPVEGFTSNAVAVAGREFDPIFLEAV